MNNIEVGHWSNGNLRYLKIYHDIGVPHNTEGPATQLWYKNGQEARRAFYINGRLYNTEGPALIEWDESGEEVYRRYLINDVEYTEEEFYEYKNTVEVSVEGGKTVRISRQSAESLNLI